MMGRFDLPEPDGTCYLAMDEVTALLEVLGTDLERGAVSSEFLNQRRLRKLHLSREQSLSDLTSREATRFGITSEIGSIVPYECPQAWAAALRAAGSQGVVYWSRFDPARGASIALFGPHGERKPWKKGREQVISTGLIERLQRECGIEMIDIPRSDEISIIGD
jgi:hypothetical protein